MASKALTRACPPQIKHYLYPIPSCHLRFVSSKVGKALDIEALLKEPSWSVRSLFDSEGSSDDAASITREKLYHLLRLSALPLPKSENEEAKMIIDLQAQLKFVQAIQKVDTEGVAPLQSIRDETEEGRKRATITLETLKDEFEKEEVVGKRGRIRRKSRPDTNQSQVQPGEREQKWDPLTHAPKRQGPYFVVDTEKD